MNTKLKRRLAMVVMLLMFFAYYLMVDPDVKLFQDLSYGGLLILTLNIFVVAIASIVVIEFIPDYFIDEIYGKEKLLREKASETSDGASRTLIAKSIRILAYSIIIAAAIVSYSMK